MQPSHTISFVGIHLALGVDLNRKLVPFQIFGIVLTHKSRDSFMRQAPILSIYTPQTLYTIDHNNIYKNHKKTNRCRISTCDLMFLLFEFIKSNLLNRTNSFKIASTSVNRTETHIFNIFIKGHGFREKKTINSQYQKLVLRQKQFYFNRFCQMRTFLAEYVNKLGLAPFDR